MRSFWQQKKYSTQRGGRNAGEDITLSAASWQQHLRLVLELLLHAAGAASLTVSDSTCRLAALQYCTLRCLQAAAALSVPKLSNTQRVQACSPCSAIALRAACLLLLLKRFS